MAGNKNLIHIHAFANLQCQAELFRGIAFTSLTGTDAVTDIAKEPQTDFIQFVANIQHADESAVTGADGKKLGVG